MNGFKDVRGGSPTRRPWRWPWRQARRGVMAVLVFPGFCGGKAPPAPVAPTPVATTLTVNPSVVKVAERDTRQLTATLLDQLGQPFVAPILWASSDPLVVEVSDSGSVLAVERGQAVVWARTGSLLQTVPVTVVAPLTVSISYRIVPPDSISTTTADSAAACVYRLKAVAAGGAPGDSATWLPSAIEYLDASGKLTTVELDSTQMLDRFATLVMRGGDTLETYPLRVTDGAWSGIVYRVRYQVGAQARSERVPISCPKAGEPPGSDTVPRRPIQPRRQP